MKLVVGLGNPGSEYRNTLHNVGFWVVDTFLARHNNKVKGFLFAKPQTFMNLSGDAVAPLLKETKTEPQDLLVIHDDADLLPGRIQLKFGGGTGGHNGLNSIVERLGTKDFWRLRVGIGKDSSKQLADYVLEPVPKEILEKMGEHAAVALDIIVREGLSKGMNLINSPSFQKVPK